MIIYFTLIYTKWWSQIPKPRGPIGVGDDTAIDWCIENGDWGVMKVGESSRKYQVEKG